DVPAIVDLCNAIEAIDQVGNGTSVAELQVDLANPMIDPERDLALWEDDSGKLAALGALWIHPANELIEAHFWMHIHPDARGSELDRDLADWGTQRLREIADARNLPARLRVGTRDDNAYRIGIVERNGFQRDRFFFAMARLLDQPIDALLLPEGFTIRALDGENEVAAWIETFNLSFVDHWNHHDMTIERREHWMKSLDYRPELDLVAVAPDGTLAAFSYCTIEAANNQRMGVREGWVSDLGTRRAYRRCGLARALLAESLRIFKQAGMDTAKLGVDAQNPNGALQLYESVGFQKVETWLSYVKDV
ncbi:MAG: GNAT family N-acetyltransferase, partial [Roseiflexaceae bacterium]